MSYGANFIVDSSWNTGFTGSITLRNANTSAVNGWRVEFDAPFDITNLWNGRILSHVGNHYVVANADWNGAIAANGSVNFGFQAASQGAPIPPAHLTVNGETVGGGTPAPTLPALSVADLSIVEGSAGTVDAGFKVTLSKASSETVSVAYSTADGTAHAGSDFKAAAGVLNFAPGETAKTVSVGIIGDALVEGNESFSLKLSDPARATVAKAVGAGTIVDDDKAAPAPLPKLAVSDIQVHEGSGGSTTANFTVTLSSAAQSKVTVGYQTENGTAVAGSDYTAASGTVEFKPGETTKTISVKVAPDTLREATETFNLKLAGPTGATLDKATGTATILDDDGAAARPTISVADIAFKEGNPVTTSTGSGGSGGAGAGFFHTSGSQIVDAAGHNVKIAGVSWFGMESDRYSPDGLNVRNYKDMMHQMEDLGFNSIRLPFSDQLFDSESRPNGIDFNKNPDLAGLSGLQVMDKIVDYAGQIGMKIILDHHRSSAGAGTSENGLWYNDAYNEQKWIADWTMLAKHYAGNATVIGGDLHNEPHNGTWGGGGANDWAAAAERAGNAVLKANPDWLVFVEGVESYQNNYYWWGGNLMGVKDRPVTLATPGHLVYSAHDYPNSIYGQPWFNDPSFPNNLPAKFDQMWGYIARENIAPVYLGEFGSRLSDPKDQAWLSKLTSYLSGDYDANGTKDIAAGKEGASWTWWSWNPNSGDTGGILKDDWTSVNQNKVDSLHPIMSAFAGGGEGTTTTVDGTTVASFKVMLSAASAVSVSVDYATVPGTAGAGDFTAASGTVTFAPGETAKTVNVAVRGDGAAEADETFKLALSAPRNADLGKGTATATILNDDGTPPSTTPPGTAGGTGTATPPATGSHLAAATTITDNWGSGAVATTALKNTGSTEVHDWQVKLDTPLAITNIWNAEIVSHKGNEYVIAGADWNDDLAPGQEADFGFQVAGNASGTSFEWLV